MKLKKKSNWFLQGLVSKERKFNLIWTGNTFAFILLAKCSWIYWIIPNTRQQAFFIWNDPQAHLSLASFRMNFNSKIALICSLSSWLSCVWCCVADELKPAEEPNIYQKSPRCSRLGWKLLRHRVLQCSSNSTRGRNRGFIYSAGRSEGGLCSELQLPGKPGTVVNYNSQINLVL